MVRRHPRSTPIVSLIPSSTLFRSLDCGGSPQAAGLRPRSPELGLCRGPADIPALRAVAAIRASERGLQQLRLRRPARLRAHIRSEEHTSDLQSLMRNSYAVFCLIIKKRTLD